MVYPLASLGMKAWTTLGAAGSLVSMAWIPRKVQTGVRLPKDLRPVNLYPPSTFSALVVESNTGMSLPLSACPAAKIAPSTAAFNIHSVDMSPLRHTSAARPVQYKCMFTPKAVGAA